MQRHGGQNFTHPNTRERANFRGTWGKFVLSTRALRREPKNPREPGGFGITSRPPSRASPMTARWHSGEMLTAPCGALDSQRDAKLTTCPL